MLAPAATARAAGSNRGSPSGWVRSIELAVSRWRSRSPGSSVAGDSSWNSTRSTGSGAGSSPCSSTTTRSRFFRASLSCPSASASGRAGSRTRRGALDQLGGVSLPGRMRSPRPRASGPAKASRRAPGSARSRAPDPATAARARAGARLDRVRPGEDRVLPWAPAAGSPASGAIWASSQARSSRPASLSGGAPSLAAGVEAPWQARTSATEPWVPEHWPHRIDRVTTASCHAVMTERLAEVFGSTQRPGAAWLAPCLPPSMASSPAELNGAAMGPGGWSASRRWLIPSTTR